MAAQERECCADKKQLVPNAQDIGPQEKARDSFRIRNGRPIAVDTGVDHVGRKHRIPHDYHGGQVPPFGPRPCLPGQHRKPDGIILEDKARDSVGNPDSQDHGGSHDRHVLRADIGRDRNQAHCHESDGDEGQIPQQRRVDPSCQQECQCQEAKATNPVFQNKQDKSGERHEHGGKQLTGEPVPGSGPPGQLAARISGLPTMPARTPSTQLKPVLHATPSSFIRSVTLPVWSPIRRPASPVDQYFLAMK